jgi:hypothetical protein
MLTVRRIDSHAPGCTFAAGTLRYDPLRVSREARGLNTLACPSNASLNA